jgi:divalent metal cation (Fe/Co/Zn/Cd) transporter
MSAQQDGKRKSKLGWWAGIAVLLAYVGWMIGRCVRSVVLLDRSVGQATHLPIQQVLAHHFQAYERFEGVRSRRSGGKVFVELALDFDGRLSLAEAHRRASAIKAHIAREIEGADVAILLSPHGEGQQPA